MKGRLALPGTQLIDLELKTNWRPLMDKAMQAWMAAIVPASNTRTSAAYPRVDVAASGSFIRQPADVFAANDLNDFAASVWP